MRRLLREPLLHFLALGALLFWLYGWMKPVEASAPDRIVVGAGQVEHLATAFARMWQRPPTAAELKGLIDDHVKEEILSREAVVLGLDRNDTVIRRRLRQKMEFVVEDMAITAEPSEAELEEFLRAHPDDFREETRTSFRHVFLSEERADRLEADAAELLAQLRAAGPGADTSQLGDRLLLPGELTLEPHRAVASQFGSEFAESLDGVPAGVWSGPLRSAYGLHLVLVSERAGDRLPALAEVRDAVRRELLAARRERMSREFEEALLERYQVMVEWPQLDDRTAPAGADAAHP